LSRLTLIYVLLVTISGCSAVKKEEKTRILDDAANVLSLNELIKANLTNNDFNIIKAEIEVINKGEKQRFIAGLKYKAPGTYLISLKSKAGIEGARIFISQDTILVNDRLNKKLFYGSPAFLKQKYGVSTDALPVVMGDYIEEIDKGNIIVNCTKNRRIITEVIEKKEFNYTIDCRERKVIETRINNETEGFILLFGKFNDFSGKHFPGSIRIEDNYNDNSINIYIEKIEFNLIEKIEFIPGKGYERIEMK
jgi:hypothetical protein